MNNTIIFLSFLIIVLSVTLDISINAKIDTMAGKILATIKLFGIKIITIDFDVLGLYYKVNNSKKLKKISDIFSKENNYLFGEIKKSILDKLYVSKISVESSLGLLKANTIASTVAISRMLGECINEKMDRGDVLFEHSFLPNFVSQNITLTVGASVHFTIFDMAFALIISFYKRGKYVKKISKSKS